MNEMQVRKKFGFSDNLTILRLDEVAWFQEGPGVRKSQFVNKGIKLLNVANIEKNEISLNKSKNFISNDEAKGKYSHFLVENDDLVMASSGIKIKNFDEKIAFIRKEHLPLCMNTSTIRFRSLDNNKLDIQYFSWFLRSDCFKKQVQFWVTGSAQLNFGPSHLKKMYVCVPCLKKQQEISQILALADNLCQKRKEQLALLDDYLKSLFLEMFGDPRSDSRWNLVDFGDVIDVLTDYHANGSYEVLRKHVKLKSIPDYALMVRTTDLENRNFTDDVKYISKEAYNFLEKSKIYGEEIIINKIGSAGNVYLMPNLNRPVSLGMNAFLLRFKKITNNIFIFYLLSSYYGKSIIKSKVKGAVTKTIRKDAVRSLKIPLPPLELQNKFASIVDQVEQTKQKIRASLIEMDNHFNALMQRYFE